MLPLEHSAILSTCIKLLVVIKTFVLSIFEWLFYTGFIVLAFKGIICAHAKSGTNMTRWKTGLIPLSRNTAHFVIC